MSDKMASSPSLEIDEAALADAASKSDRSSDKFLTVDGTFFPHSSKHREPIAVRVTLARVIVRALDLTLEEHMRAVAVERSLNPRGATYNYTDRIAGIYTDGSSQSAIEAADILAANAMFNVRAIVGNVVSSENGSPEFSPEKERAARLALKEIASFVSAVNRCDDPAIRADMLLSLGRLIPAIARCGNLDEVSSLPRQRKSAIGPMLTAKRREKAVARRAELSAYLVSEPKLANALSDPDPGKRYDRIRRWLARKYPERFAESNRRTAARDLKAVLQGIAAKRR